MAANNKIRSLFDIYTQRSEYEARLKVQRMKRDLDLKEFLNREDVPEFKRNIKIVNIENEVEEDFKEEKVDVEQEIKDFICRSKTVLDSYYERAFINDKLGGLDSKEIIHRIKDTPTNTKNFVKPILKELDKHGIRLHPETGEVDYSLVKNQNIINKLKNSGLVKYALLQREDQFNYPHLKNQKTIADELRREVNRLKRSEQKDKEELEAAKAKQQTSGIIDKALGFEYDNIENTDFNLEDQRVEELSVENLKYGAEYRLDSKN